MPRATGLRSVGEPYQSVTIKYKKKPCGTIYAPTWSTEDHKWSISLMVEEEKANSNDWKWVKFKARFETEKEARQWLQDHGLQILSRYKLRFDEEFDMD